MRYAMIAIGLIVMAWLVGITLPAMAQPVPCGPHAAIMARLAERYGEVVIWRGESPRARFMLTASASGGWTIVVTDGRKACIVGAGHKNALDMGT